MKLCWFLVLIHCPLCSLFPPAAHIIPSEGDKRYFAYSYHYKKSFLPSVPRCCSVITDILKKQRKKIAGEGKDFCWGISSFWSWMAGRIWQQEEKWFLRIDRDCNKCVGLCLAWLWDLPKHKGEAFHGFVLAVECGTKLCL